MSALCRLEHKPSQAEQNLDAAGPVTRVAQFSLVAVSANGTSGVRLGNPGKGELQCLEYII